MANATCHERQRGRGPAAQIRRDRPRAERERQHPWLEIRLERVGARLRDAMAKRQQRREHRNAQPRFVHDAADGDDRAEQQRHSSEVSGEEHGPNRHAARAHERRDGVVVEHESILRVQDRSIAREQFGIEVLRDSRDVERLIAHAVAVAAAVENGDEAKRKRACGERGTSIDAQRARILLDQMAVIATRPRRASGCIHKISRSRRRGDASASPCRA